MNANNLNVWKTNTNGKKFELSYSTSQDNWLWLLIIDY